MRDHLFTLIKDGEYQKEIRGIRLKLQDNTDRVQHIPPSVPPTWRESHCFLGVASALSCSLTERSTEEETPIARAVSGSLCVIKRFADL